jgi:hypothetical protein
VANDHLRRATLAADGRTDASWPPGESAFLAAVRTLIADRSRVDSHVETPAEQALLSAGILLATWLAAVRIALALAAYVLARSAIPAGPIPVEAHLLLVLAMGGAGALLVYGGRREFRSLALGSVFVLLASAFTPRMMSPLLTQPILGPVAAFAARLPTEAMFGAAVWLFALAFPSAPSGRPVQRMALAMGWLSAAVGFLLIVLNIAGPFAPDARWAELAHHRNPGRSLFWPLLMLASAPVLPVILWKSRTVRVLEQRRITRFAWALTLGLLPAAFLLGGTILNPSIREHLERYQREYGLVLYGGLATIPITTGYAIGASRVLPAHLVIRTALLASLARSSLVLMVAAPVLWLALAASRSAGSTLEAFIQRTDVKVALTIAAAGGLLLFLRPQVTRLIERAFERRRTETGRALALAAGHIRTAIGGRELAAAVRKSLEDAFGTSQAMVLTGPLTGSALTSPLAGIRPLPRGSALVAMLETEPVAMVVSGPSASRCVRLLPAEERDFIESAQAVVLCGIPNTSGRLLGVVVLGVRGNEQPYSRDDLEGIAALCSTAGIAIESRFQPESSAEPDTAAALECERCGHVLASSEASCPCGGDLKDARVPLVLSRRYRAQRRVGAGGMGVVYEGLDLTLGRRVALKALPAVTRAESARLSQEAQAMAGLSHRNIAHIYGLEFWRDMPVLAMEFMERGTLADRVRAGEHFTADERSSLHAALTSALNHLHGRGLIHRDVKPSNIGFRDDGSPALLDFGIAANEGSAEARTLAGTRAYLTEDVLGGREQTAAGDRWALDKTIRELSEQGRNDG